MKDDIKEWTSASGRVYPKISAEGTDLTTAFSEAARQFFGIFTEVSSIRPTQSVRINCESSDTDFLFADWLNTLIYESRERGMIFSEFEIQVDGIQVRGVMKGEKIDSARHPLKREFLGGAGFKELATDEGNPALGKPARVSVVLNDDRRHPLPLRELWSLSQEETK